MRVNMQLPNSVQEVADVIGREVALYLIGQLPRYIRRGNGSSVYLYVPTLARLGMNHELVRIIGWLDAEKLSRAFGGEILQLASCTCVYREFRDQHITRLFLDGVPRKLLAEWFDVSDRHIKNLVRWEIPHEENRTESLQNLATNNREKRRNDETISYAVMA